MLATIFDPFYRAPQYQRRSGDDDLLRVHHELCTEAAADIGSGYASLVFVEPQDRHQRRPHVMGELRRRPQRQPILIDVIDCKRTAAFDRVRTAPMLLETDAGPMRCACERLGDVAI